MSEFWDKDAVLELIRRHEDSILDRMAKSGKTPSIFIKDTYHLAHDHIAEYLQNVMFPADIVTRDEYAKVVLERDNAIAKLKDTGNVTRVTRCRDCRYWKHDEGYGLHFCTYVIGARFARYEDDFCSRGEA